MRKIVTAAAIALCALFADADLITCDSREIAISDVHMSGGTLSSVDVSLESVYCATGTLYAAFADSDMGENLADWTHVAVAAQEVTEADSLVNYEVPEEWGGDGYKAMRMFLVSTALKDGAYAQRLEYVDSSTSSDVDTGFVPTSKSRVEGGIMRITDEAQIAVHGAGGTQFSTWIGTQNNLTCRFCGYGAYPNMQTKDLWYYFTQDGSGFSYVDGNGTSNTVSRSGSFTKPTASLHLFNNGTDSTCRKVLRMAYWRHYTNDVLLTSYIPVNLLDGGTGFWDLATGGAVACAGLTAGPAVDYGTSVTNVTGFAILQSNLAVSTVGTREIAIAGTTMSGGRIASVYVSLAPVYCAKGTLYAAFDDSDKGDDMADWANVVVAKEEVTDLDTLVECAMPAQIGTSGYLFVRFFLVSSLLKDGAYARRLEYVDSSSDSDIDTGIGATALSRIESAFKRTEDFAQGILYGGGGTDASTHLSSWLGTQADVPWRFAGVAAKPNLLTAGLWYYLSQGYNAVPGKTSLVAKDANGTEKTNNYSSVSAAWTSTDNMHLFKNGEDTTRDAYRHPVRMAYWRHYTNDVLVTSYVPVMLCDGATVGLCDLVAGENATCAGLSAGPVVDFGELLTNVTADVIDASGGGAPIFGDVFVSGDLGHTLSASGTVFVTSGEITAVSVALEYSTDSGFSTVDRASDACDGDGVFEIATSVTPGTTYWCRLVACSQEGASATNEIGAVSAPGPSALASSISVDNSNGRHLAFSGQLSTIGIAPTYVLLICGDETRQAMA